MEKKNRFIFTIGFNANDPAHEMVVKRLNELGRGKAQYIVNAVLAYGSGNKEMMTGNASDYESIKRMVYQILEEKQASTDILDQQAGNRTIAEENNNDLLDKRDHFDSDDIGNIMQSLDSFRSDNF